MPNQCTCIFSVYVWSKRQINTFSLIQTVNEHVFNFLNWMPSRKNICQNGIKFFHSDAQSGPAIWQTPLSGRCDECFADKMPLSEHIIKKLRRSTILHQNTKGFTASKMRVLRHLAQKLEALVILLRETVLPQKG